MEKRLSLKGDKSVKYFTDDIKIVELIMFVLYDLNRFSWINFYKILIKHLLWLVDKKCKMLRNLNHAIHKNNFTGYIAVWERLFLIFEKFDVFFTIHMELKRSSDF